MCCCIEVNKPLSEAMILGVGLHPWGRWGRSFVEYATHAARAALKDAGVSSSEVQFLSAAATARQGYAGLTSGMTYARALNMQCVQINTSYGACASGVQALAAARASILAGECDVALVIGADIASDGLLKPACGEHDSDPDWIRYSLGFSNVVYLAMLARRRMHILGTTDRDLSLVKVKSSTYGSLNPYARYRYRFRIEQLESSPFYCDPLRLLHICSTSDGGAAVVLTSAAYAKRSGRPSVSIASISTPSPPFPHSELEMGYLSTDVDVGDSGRSFLTEMVDRAYEASGVSADDLALAEVYDLTCASELDWYECLGLCERGGAERLIRDGSTGHGGRVPVNTSGGLSSMGEAPSAQVLAQTCELVWQLRGEAGRRQVPDAKIGIAVSQGIFGHAGAIVLKR